MWARIPTFAVLAVGLVGLAADAARGADAAPAPAMRAAPSGEATLDAAIEALAKHRSVMAKVRQQALLFDRRIVGAGLYRQLPPQQRKVRFEMRMQIGERVSSFTHLADGRHLWRYSDLLGEKQLEQIDLARLPQPGAAATVAVEPVWIALGGLPALLTNLQTGLEFGPPRELALGELPVYLIEGTLRAAEGESAAQQRFSEPVPERVSLYLGRDDLFPYRIEYHRPAESGRRGATPPYLVMEFYEVVLNQPLDPRWFRFHPGNLQPVDATDRFRRRLAGGSGRANRTSLAR